jgi:hypothetical protein
MSTSTGVNFFKDFKSVLNLALTFERSGSWLRVNRTHVVATVGNHWTHVVATVGNDRFGFDVVAAVGQGPTLLRRFGLDVVATVGNHWTHVVATVGNDRFGFDVVATVGDNGTHVVPTIRILA